MSALKDPSLTETGDEAPGLAPTQSGIVPKMDEDLTVVAPKAETGPEELTRLARFSDIQESAVAGTLGVWSDALMATMRELYAEGDIDTALALANTLAASLDPPEPKAAAPELAAPNDDTPVVPEMLTPRESYVVPCIIVPRDDQG